jgi:hypothetical protein
VIEEVIRAKPSAAKGRYILSITLSTTMGPGIRVDPGRTRRGEIMLGAAAVTNGEGGAEEETGEGAEPAEAESAEEGATA